jgi:hypothetical protein
MSTNRAIARLAKTRADVRQATEYLGSCWALDNTTAVERLTFVSEALLRALATLTLVVGDLAEALDGNEETVR